jgi:hypothetical protein
LEERRRQAIRVTIAAARAGASFLVTIGGLGQKRAERLNPLISREIARSSAAAKVLKVMGTKKPLHNIQGLVKKVLRSDFLVLTIKASLTRLISAKKAPINLRTTVRGIKSQSNFTAAPIREEIWEVGTRKARERAKLAETDILSMGMMV